MHSGLEGYVVLVQWEDAPRSGFRLLWKPALQVAGLLPIGGQAKNPAMLSIFRGHLNYTELNPMQIAYCH
jgi:hypothetical protein